jgi:2-isopropylmalate synthase
MSPDAHRVGDHHHSLEHVAPRRVLVLPPTGAAFLLPTFDPTERTGFMSTRTDSQHVEIFDTTLRDGLQVEGVAATVEDKLRIAEQLDYLGVRFIEGGWPGANPKDIEFFARAATELDLTTSTFVAFGSTRRPRGKVDEDQTLQHLLDADTAAVCIVAKSWDYHVTEALKTSLDEGAAMIADSVEFLRGNGRQVLVDMEHFFDGYKANPEFSFRALEAAVLRGASHVVLCDTNGGSLPHEIEEIVGRVHAHVGDDVTIGIHCHDDTGCAVANSMAAVRAGARHVQGTLNGLGERTGNANLTSIIPNLQLKLGHVCLPEGRMERLTVVSHRVAEQLNRAVDPQAPYVGSSAFAHKAGLHVSAIARAKDAYEHVDPEAVGNGTRFVVSEMAGKATIQMKADDLGLALDGPAVNQVIDDLKRLEHEGYHFEAADASLELLMRRAGGWEQDFFRIESMRVITDEMSSGPFSTEATVKAWVGDQRFVFTAEGNGPVNAIDTALRHAVQHAYPQLERIHLTDYKVRILDGGEATGAVTRVLLTATDGERDWTTIGVSANIIEASWRALEESVVFGLLHAS